MRANEYDPKCDSCKISRGFKQVLGKTIIELESGWVLNHYGAPEQTFLGWLALQPRYHRMEISDLSKDEVMALGTHVQRIDSALRQYWSIVFANDPIESLYVTCFHEGRYDKPTASPYHLHMHLIPRTRKFDALLRMTDGSTIVAWDIYKIVKHPGFPQEYAITRQLCFAIAGVNILLLGPIPSFG